MQVTKGAPSATVASAGKKAGAFTSPANHHSRQNRGCGRRAEWEQREAKQCRKGREQGMDGSGPREGQDQWQ